MALCRLSQNSDAAARDAVRKGIDLMICNLARAAANDASHATAGSLPMEAATDSLLPKDSTTLGSTIAGIAGGAAGSLASSANSPSYARYLKRVLSEDGHVSLTLVHVLQIIVRNREMIYPNR